MTAIRYRYWLDCKIVRTGTSRRGSHDGVLRFPRSHRGQQDQRAQSHVRREGTGLVYVSGEPAFCKKGLEHQSAKMFPLVRSNRQLSKYDLESEQAKGIHFIVKKPW